MESSSTVPTTTTTTPAETTAAAPSSAAPAAAAATSEEPKKTEAATVASMSAAWAQASELDLVFAMDATGSMASYIQAAKDSIASVIQDIVAAEKADVRFALVAYRDHPPEEQSYVTQVFDFTKSVSEMRKQLSSISASGGGDAPEAVADALHDVSKMDFRPNATKICMMISDAPPHGLARSGDHFPNGCPLGLDPVQISHKLAEMGVTLYCVGCEPSINPYKSFFETLAFNTGGQYCALSGAKALSGMVVASAREELHLERLMGEVDSMMDGVSASASEEEQKAHIYRKLQERNVQVQHAVSKSKKPISNKARNMTKTTNMSDLRAKYEAEEEEVVPASSSDVLRECEGARMSLPSSSSGSVRGSMRAKKGGLLSGITSLFSRRDDASSECAAAAPASAPAPAPASSSMPAMPDSYSNVEATVSMEQCERLWTKHAARKTK